MKIPSNNNWFQSNEDDIFGNLHETQNISCDKPGKLTLSKKPFALYTSDDDANLAYVLNISYYNNNYIALTSDELFSFNINGGVTTQIGSSPTTSLSSDAQVVFSRYYITTSTTTDYWNGSSWAGNQETLTTGVPHPMTVFDSLPTYKLSIGNGNSVIQLDNGGNTGQALTLPAQYQVTTMRYRNGYLYVGTKHLNGGDAKVFIWDGNTGNANYEVPTGSSWVFSMCEYGNTVAFITEKGQLLLVNGTQATQLAALPVYYDPNAIWQSSGGLTLNGKVMHRGMVSIGDTIYINIDATVDSGFIPEMKSGLWVYDPQNGLTHRSYHSSDRWVEDDGITASSSVITTTAAHGLKTGDTIQFTVVSGLTGVDTQVPYYVDVQSTTTFKIALSRKALANGNYVEISGTATSDAIIYVPNNDIGTGYDVLPGAIAHTTPNEAQLKMWSSPVVWGSACSDLDGNRLYTLQCFTDSWNIGTLSTQKIFTDNLLETWKKVTAFVFGIYNNNEQAILKYKKETTNDENIVYRGVWANTNTIHSISSTYDEQEWDDIEIGNEINIIDGYGRGYTAHVLSKESSSSTFVVTIDESIGTAEKPVYFYIDNYRKIQSLSSDRTHKNLLEWAWSAIKSPFIQLKVELRGFQTEFVMFDVQNGRDK